MRSKSIQYITLFGLLLLFLAAPRTSHTAFDCNLASNYSATPIFTGNTVPANIMILYSNDHTNFYCGYNSTTYDDTAEYYGYFDPNKEYTYSSYFTPVGPVTTGTHRVTTTGRWSGNFLNWLTMSHGDFTRKAMTGGKRSTDTTTQTILERGDIPSDHKWSRTIANANYYTPLTGTQYFCNTGTTFFKDANNNQTQDSGDTAYTVRVEVCKTSVGVEENALYYSGAGIYKPVGLLQRFMDKVNFGLMGYSYAKEDSGGVVRANIRNISDEITTSSGVFASTTGMIAFINGFGAKGWDPVGEMYYEAIRYFKGLAPTTQMTVTSPDGNFPAYCNQTTALKWTDPVQYKCQKNFIIIVNDEFPSKDSDLIPGSNWQGTISSPMSINVTDLTRQIGDMEGITNTNRIVANAADGVSNDTCDSKLIRNLGKVRGICPGSTEATAQGTFYIAGLAYYAYTTDLRSDFDGTQNITTYAIAFRSSPSGYSVPPPPMNQLYLAAKYGGFDDQNSNGKPDTGEWEGDVYGGYTWPKNMAHAETGSDFETAMLKILNDILVRSSSGTAASLVTSSENGEGQLYQAYFEQLRYGSDGSTNATWMGFVHSLWVDAYGNLREDTNSDHHLSLKVNKIVKIRFDTDTNTTVVDRYADANGDGVPDTTVPQSTVPLAQIKPIFEASHQLSLKAPSTRVIKTFADKNLDGTVDTGEFIDFNSTNAATIAPFLGVTSTTERDNVISYIRGTDVTGYRNRTLDSEHFLLGDIIHSSPTPVAKPMENYDLIYGDKTYMAYYTKYKNRPTYVYTGSNDGMLHSFYGGIYHAGDDPSTTGVTEDAYIEVETGKTLGAEAWAYIPNNLLPHLKWLTCTAYPHVYYVDLKPKIIDARIFSTEWTSPTGTHPYGWGTILVGGMGFGGSPISVTGTFNGTASSTQTFTSAYFAIDITDPTNPQLLWEKRYTNMGYTLSYPVVARIQSGTAAPDAVAFADQKWLLVMGNGPNSLTGDPSGSGYVYVVDLLTGTQQRAIATPSPGTGATEFLASPAAIDLPKDTSVNYPDYNIDAFYIGSTIKTSTGAYQGKMYRIATDSNDTGTTPDFTVGNWTLSTLINPGKPITSAPSLALIDNKVWVYFGTGRYLGNQDKANSDQQAYYGIKDPCTYVYGTCSTTVVQATDLVDVTNIKVYEGGYVTGLSVSTEHAWADLLDEFNSKSGFVRNLATTTGSPSERVIAKPAVIGGLTIFPTFTPNTDLCSFSGTSSVYALYYQTGPPMPTASSGPTRPVRLRPEARCSRRT